MAGDTAITQSEFNSQVKTWTEDVKKRAIARLQAATAGGVSGSGKRSMGTSYKRNYGDISSVGFRFNYYLVFIHYGVGRGYIRKNGTVIRGHRDDNGKYRTYRGRAAKTWRNYASDSRPVMRHGFDWIDVEIRQNIDRLADIAVEYHGDKALNEVLRQTDKLLIEKK